MGVDLFTHNQLAYEAALTMLEECGKAAVIHPTGTGKSFIGFKLCEEHPDDTVCWLSPSEYIFKTQIENWLKAGGEYPKKIAFFTYAKLMGMEESELSEIKPAYIVLDEFHRCGAEMWGQGVQTLLSACPSCPVLGLSATNIRYLDNQRDMADELFDGNIASQMTLGEAIVRGILNPPKYVLSVFSYEKDYQKYKTRVEKSKSPWAKDKAERILLAMQRALELADGIDVIFDKHMIDRTGKYIVFCANFEHMKAMIAESRDWFRLVDNAPKIYSVYSYDPEASQSFADFKADRDDSHLRLLYCIDALNEGIHVDGISGVILLRPTVSPIVYKQQIGRAMTASKSKDAVIFDIVDNISGLYSIDSLQEEVNSAADYLRYLGEDSLVMNESFRVYDEVRDCRALFEELEHTLSASWEQMLDMARAYYEENGDLLPPASYTTEDGFRLGQWIITQRINYRKQLPALTAERIAALEAIGMSWFTRHERLWEESFSSVERYFRAKGSLDGLSGHSPQAYNWVLCQRQRYRNGQLTKEQVERLSAVGMIWEPEDTWKIKYEAAREYFFEKGNLDIPAGYVTESGITLGAWYRSVRAQYRDGLLSEERIRMLEGIGINWVSVKTRTWMRYYELAREYARLHANADVPADYVADNGMRLGTWISGQRHAYARGKLPQEQIRLLEELGISWQRDDSRWDAGYSSAARYHRLHGNVDVTADYVTADGYALGRWINTQRTKKRQGRLSAERTEKLEALGVIWSPQDAMWQTGYVHAKAYYSRHGDLRVPSGFIDDDGFRLGAWIGSKRTQYRKGNLSRERIQQLETIGMIWSRPGTAKPTGREKAALRPIPTSAARYAG